MSILNKDSFLARFLKQESAGGVLLVGAAVLAIILANTPLNKYYQMLIDIPVALKLGAFEIDKPLLLWVNDGLMAVFFLWVGLELKTEFLEGELSNLKSVVLPGLGAIGGMVVPALIYSIFNAGDPVAIRGWAIPAATDIAFALGILSLVSPKIPTSLKVFLVSLAIFDDIGAIIIIAFFYTSNISMTALIIALSCILVLFLMNRCCAEAKSLYILVGIVMWTALLKSGVHATLAGVLLAMFFPMQSKTNPEISPLKSFEHDLRPAVVYFILPLFAFTNSGIDIRGMELEQLIHNVPLGIALGLFLGKQIGVFFFCWLGIKLGLTVLPAGMKWSSLYGVAILCGIGFTMSLFIGSLAFEETGVNLIFDERLGIIIGSLASGILGYIILKRSTNQNG